MMERKWGQGRSGFFAFEDLDVYGLAVDFAASIYELSAVFPDAERFGLTSQIRRASTSVALNIAEGRGRGTDPDFARFLWQARGSVFECVSAVHLARRLTFLAADDGTDVLEQAHVLSSKLTALIHRLTPPRRPA
ncbi:four helix bundle protein [Deinococcus yunweiensis]|uniref:four helix bundle protein n=1 Tax=Deinococcus yunweiensis TaxID=367282 RepID=UPI00398E9A33